MSATAQPCIAVTSGEPAGIGPDICLSLAARPLPMKVVVLADRGLLAARASQLGVAVSLREYHRGHPAQPGALDVMHVPLGVSCRAGVLDTCNARYVLQLIDRGARAPVAHLALEQVRSHAARSTTDRDRASAASNPERQPSSWKP